MQRAQGTTKRLRRRGASGPLLGFFLLLLLLPSVSSGWGTLCIGADGHVNLELRAIERCRDEVGQKHEAHEAPQAHPEHPDHLEHAEAPPCCGPCTHVQIASGDGLPSGSSAKLPPALPLPAALVPPIVRDERVSGARTPDPSFSGRARILASVVLRI